MPRRADHTTVELHRDVYRKLANKALAEGVTVPQLIARGARDDENAAPRGVDALERRVELLETVVQEVVAKRGRRTA